jgi:signal transduction histidine kinase
MSDTTIQEMVRFNEAIDQALAESIVTYSSRADRTRDLFLAVLGHDLRAPLATVALAAELLMRTELPHSKITELALKARRSTRLMAAMITDLLGFTRLQMGAGMPTRRLLIDAEEVCKAAATDAQAMYPDSTIEFHVDGNLTGMFDAVRLQQLINNLLINAAQHSDSGHELTLSATGLANAIEIKVHNIGQVIPQESLSTIFQPLVQLDPDASDEAKPRTSLGLGLFIAHQTTIEHEGTISVTSDAIDGTVFTVTFPRAQ